MYNPHCHFSSWEEMDIDKEDISSVMISSLFMLNSVWFFFFLTPPYMRAEIP